ETLSGASNYRNAPLRSTLREGSGILLRMGVSAHIRRWRQVCAVSSLEAGSMSAMAILQQLQRLRRVARNPVPQFDVVPARFQTTNPHLLLGFESADCRLEPSENTTWLTRQNTVFSYLGPS